MTLEASEYLHAKEDYFKKGIIIESMGKSCDCYLKS